MGTRFSAHNRCLVMHAVCESRPAAARSRFTGSVTPTTASSSAVARRPHARALGLVESIRVQIAIYRPRKCLTPKRAPIATLLHAECVAGPSESDKCRALEHVEATNSLVAKRLFLRLDFQGKAHSDVFSSTHTWTGQRIDITKPGGPNNSRSFFTVI